MKSESYKDKSALDSVHPPTGYDWEWPAVFILIILAIIWLWRTHARNMKERERAAKLCKDSLKSKS